MHCITWLPRTFLSFSFKWASETFIFPKRTRDVTPADTIWPDQMKKSIMFNDGINFEFNYTILSYFVCLLHFTCFIVLNITQHRLKIFGNWEYFTTRKWKMLWNITAHLTWKGYFRLAINTMKLPNIFCVYDVNNVLIWQRYYFIFCNFAVFCK